MCLSVHCRECTANKNYPAAPARLTDWCIRKSLLRHLNFAVSRYLYSHSPVANSSHCILVPSIPWNAFHVLYLYKILNDLVMKTRNLCLFKMATTFGKKIPYKQDLPPRSGYPGIEFARNLPKRGPSGIALFAGCGLVMAYGFANVIMFNRKMRFVYMVGKIVHPKMSFSERQNEN